MARNVKDEMKVEKDKRPSDNYVKKSYKEDPKLKNLVETPVSASELETLRTEKPELIFGFKYTNLDQAGRAKKDRETGSLIPDKDGKIGIVISKVSLKDK